MSKNTQKHTLTKAQAARIGLKPGDVVDVILQSDERVKQAGATGRFAKEVYFNGKYWGGNLQLDEDD